MEDCSKSITRYIENYSLRCINKRILDVGCGMGNFTYFFGKKNVVTGIDIQNVVLKRYRNFSFKIGDTTNLKLRINTFDIVISFDVIEHIQRDVKMIAEIYKVLKPGGKLLLGTPNKNRLTNIVFKIIGRPRKYPLNLGHDSILGDTIHIREYTESELYSKLRSAGFKKIKILPFWFGMPNIPFGIIYPFRPLSQFSQYLFAEATK